MTPERTSKDDVVLTGGGAKGAYEIGILNALFAGRSPSTGFQPVVVEVFAGTSVGANNTAFLVSQATVPPALAVADLEDIWRRRIANTDLSCGSGVFRLRAGPLAAPSRCSTEPPAMQRSGCVTSPSGAQSS